MLLYGTANENTARYLNEALKTSYVQLELLGMFPSEHSSMPETYPSPETELMRDQK